MLFYQVFADTVKANHSRAEYGRRLCLFCTPNNWPLTFWPWKWWPSHVWCRLPLPILVFLGLSVLELGPMYATDRRQTKASLNASTLWGHRHKNAYTNNLNIPSIGDYINILKIPYFTILFIVFTILFPSVLWQQGHPVCKKLGVVLLVVTIWLELCISYSSSCHHHLRHP